MTKLARLPRRCVIQISGEDRLTFLQGLVSNDVALVTPGVAVWAALLTPQGKWLSDFFMFSGAESILLDCEVGQAADIARRLLRYRLRAKVDIASTDCMVYAAWDGEPPAAAYSAPDPRLPLAGWRLLSPDAIETSAAEADYDSHRMMLGLPDGSRDLEPEKSVLLEAGFAELNGISWTKGCYMGQELTARTRYRGLLKRRLVPVQATSSLPPPSTPVFSGDVEAGVLRSTQGMTGLALLRLENFSSSLSCGGVTLEVCLPAWLSHSA